MKTAAQWLEILISCGVKAGTAVRWADSFSVEVLESSFSRGVAEMDDFLANVLHESAMLETLEENLNYSAEGLINGFGRHRISIADALRYGRTAEHQANKPGIASCLYGGAWGLKNLGNKEPGDGFAFRGSGLIQCTGRANFEYLELITGLPVVSNPDMLRRPGPEAIAVAVAWWEGKVPDHVLDDIARTRRAVNGGDKGLAHVASLTDQLGDALA